MLQIYQKRNTESSAIQYAFNGENQSEIKKEMGNFGLAWINSYLLADGHAAHSLIFYEDGMRIHLNPGDWLLFTGGKASVQTDTVFKQTHHVTDQAPVKDHELRQLVNDLRDLAVKFYNHQSLRDRLSYLIGPYFRRKDSIASPKVDLQILEQVNKLKKDKSCTHAVGCRRCDVCGFELFDTPAFKAMQEGDIVQYQSKASSSMFSFRTGNQNHYLYAVVAAVKPKTGNLSIVSLDCNWVWADMPAEHYQIIGKASEQQLTNCKRKLI